MCVSVFWKFKYAWYKLVGTLYKFLMLFAFLKCLLCFLPIEKHLWDKNASKIHASQTWLWWLWETNLVTVMHYIIISTFTVVLMNTAHFSLYVTAGTCRIRPSVIESVIITDRYVNTHSFETSYKYFDCGTKTKRCSNSVSRISTWSFIL